MDKQNLTLPISIVIAAIVIAGTIYYTKKDSAQPSNPEELPPQEQEIKGPAEINSGDHVLGNPEAPLTLILYTDFECPFCKKFHETIKKVIEEYGKAGKVRIVFRHFPLDQLHKKSRTEAESTECVASIGGNEKFWEYTGLLFEITPSNDEMDLSKLPDIAEGIGINKEEFLKCLNEKEFADKVQANYEDAVALGANGTPYFVIINQKGQKFPVSGALPYEELKLGLDQMLSQEEQ